MDIQSKEKYKEWGKKGGAPKKKDSDKRRCFIGIHLTEEEKTKLTTLVGKHKMKQSDLVRKLIFDGAEKLLTNLRLAETMQIRIELRKIGVNINQMAKIMNTEKAFIISDKHREQLQYLEKSIKDILESAKV